MKSLDRYILKQLIAPLAVAIVVVTAIVWLTQSLQRLELVIEHGEGWAGFFWLTMLMIPSLLIVVLPFAVFGAVLFALQRLHSDNEIAVLFASGVSKMRLSLPILAVAFLGAIATLWINLDLAPRSYRELKRQVAEIRADFAAMLVRGGEFTTFGDGFTVYTEESLADGGFKGLLIHDYRNPKKQDAYTAQFGQIRDTDAGPVLYLSNGTVQTLSKEANEIDIVSFQQTALNIDGFRPQDGDLQLELTERYLHELLRPNLNRAWDRDNAGRLAAEAHARLAAPFYPLTYSLIALYALIGGQYSRRGYGARIAGACAGAASVRIAAFVAQSSAAQTEAYWILYALPVAPAVVLFILMAGIAPIQLPRIGGVRAPSQSEA